MKQHPHPRQRKTLAQGGPRVYAAPLLTDAEPPEDPTSLFDIVSMDGELLHGSLTKPAANRMRMQYSDLKQGIIMRPVK